MRRALQAEIKISEHIAWTSTFVVISWCFLIAKNWTWSLFGFIKRLEALATRLLSDFDRLWLVCCSHLDEEAGDIIAWLLSGKSSGLVTKEQLDKSGWTTSAGSSLHDWKYIITPYILLISGD